MKYLSIAVAATAALANFLPAFIRPADGATDVKYILSGEVKETLLSKYWRLCEIETGFEDDGWTPETCKAEPPANVFNAIVERSNEIRDGFVFMALSFLRLSEFQLRWFVDIDPNVDIQCFKAANSITAFAGLSQSMMAIMSAVGLFEPMDMLLFYIYTNQVGAVYDHLNTNNVSGVAALWKLTKMHRAVVDELRALIAMQNRRNRFNVLDSVRYKKHDQYILLNVMIGASTYNLATELLDDYLSDVDQAIKENALRFFGSTSTQPVFGIDNSSVNAASAKMLALIKD